MSNENEKGTFLKEIDFTYPGGVKHRIYVTDVKTTYDGKYVLNYYEDKNGKFSIGYTEIVKVGDTWYRYPFKKKLISYNFKPFDMDLSEEVLKELPSSIGVKVFVNKDKKSGHVSYDRDDAYDAILKLTGSTVARDGDDKKYIYMVLFTTDKEGYILKREGKISYNFDFAFPAFSVPYEVQHYAGYLPSEIDPNSDVTYAMDEYTKENLPIGVRRAVSKFFNSIDEDKVNISKLPILEVTNSSNNEQYNIHFVTCPDLNLFSDIYKAEYLGVDKDMNVDSYFDNSLESALHYELPLIISNSNETKTNGVKHLNNDIVK